MSSRACRYRQEIGRGPVVDELKKRGLNGEQSSPNRIWRAYVADPPRTEISIPVHQKGKPLELMLEVRRNHLSPAAAGFAQGYPYGDSHVRLHWSIRTRCAACVGGKPNAMRSARAGDFCCAKPDEIEAGERPLRVRLRGIGLA